MRAMTLAEFIEKRHAGNQLAFATAAGVDPGQLSKYLARERGEHGSLPSAANVARIEAATGGRIGASHWLGLSRKSAAA